MSKGLHSASATPSERRLAAQSMARESWDNTPDRTARTAPARAALEAKWLTAANGDPQRAAALRKEYYKQLALKSAQARRTRAKALAETV